MVCDVAAPVDPRPDLELALGQRHGILRGDPHLRVQLEPHLVADPDRQPAQVPCDLVVALAQLVEREAEQRLHGGYSRGAALVEDELQEPRLAALVVHFGHGRQLGRKPAADGAHRVDQLGRAVVRVCVLVFRVVEEPVQEALAMHEDEVARVQPRVEVRERLYDLGVAVERVARDRAAARLRSYDHRGVQVGDSLAERLRRSGAGPGAGIAAARVETAFAERAFLVVLARGVTMMVVFVGNDRHVQFFVRVYFVDQVLQRGL